MVLASDHYIKDELKFKKAIDTACKISEEGRLVTFGVIPTSPETGYGYIKTDKSINLNSLEALNVSDFIEKPNKKDAEEFISNERFLWNSGCLCLKLVKF